MLKSFKMQHQRSVRSKVHGHGYKVQNQRPKYKATMKSSRSKVRQALTSQDDLRNRVSSAWVHDSKTDTSFGTWWQCYCTFNTTATVMYIRTRMLQKKCTPHNFTNTSSFPVTNNATHWKRLRVDCFLYPPAMMLSRQTLCTSGCIAKKVF